LLEKTFPPSSLPVKTLGTFPPPPTDQWGMRFFFSREDPSFFQPSLFFSQAITVFSFPRSGAFPLRDRNVLPSTPPSSPYRSNTTFFFPPIEEGNKCFSPPPSGGPDASSQNAPFLPLFPPKRPRPPPQEVVFSRKAVLPPPRFALLVYFSSLPLY